MYTRNDRIEVHKLWEKMKIVMMRSSQYNNKIHNHITVKWEVRQNELHKIRKKMSCIYRNIRYKYPEKYLQTKLLPSGFSEFIFNVILLTWLTFHRYHHLMILIVVSSVTFDQRKEIEMETGSDIRLIHQL